MQDPDRATAASGAAEVDAPEPVDTKPEHGARGGTPALGEESGQIDADKVEAEVTMEVSLSDDEPLSHLLITGVAAAEPSPSKKPKKLKRKRKAIIKTEQTADEPTIAQNIAAEVAAEAIEPQQPGSKKPKRKRSLATLALKAKQTKKILPPETPTTTMILRSMSHS